MNPAHVHLLLNHFPVIGFGVGLALFVIGFIWKDEYLTRVSFVIFFVIALLTIPTYLSGNAAQQFLKNRSDVSQVLITKHEDAALLAFVFMEMTGFVAWLGLWYFRLISCLPRWNVWVVLLLSVVTFGLMARVANMGGEISHPEIRSTEQTKGAGDATPPGVVESMGPFISGMPSALPTLQTVHLIGLALVFTVVLFVNLRLLGMAKCVSFAGLYQLLPVGMLGFGLNLTTGILMFIATPNEYTTNIVFFWKILLITLAGINSLYFVLLDEPWKVGNGNDAPPRAKLIAASAIFLWVGVLYCGHMLPFLGNAF